MYKKGDVVLVNAQTVGKRSNNYRVLSTTPYPKPQKGIVLGYSFIRTGYVVQESRGGLSRIDDYDNYEPGYLKTITDNKVWVIELFSNSNRYLKPVRALEIDIEFIE